MGEELIKMTEKYFNIKYSEKPEAQGHVLKIKKKGKLELLTGSQEELDKMNIKKRKIIGGYTINKDYFMKKIGRKEAEEKVEQQRQWDYLGMWMDDSEPSSPGLFGPGGEQLI